MRQIGTMPEERSARTLADYLLTQGIETQLIPEAGGWEIWVRDEDRLPAAKEALTAFSANPSDPRFHSAADAAAAIRQADERANDRYRRQSVDLAERFGSPATRLQPVTLTLIVLSVATTIFTAYGDHKLWLSQWLFITPFVSADGFVYFPGLAPIRSGEVWRLVTPIFLHFSLVHLAGNMLWLYYLGSQIEARRGSIRFLLIVLIVAVLSNLAEYALGGLRFEQGRWTTHYNPSFGGMSGVVFGLFGYVWMKMRFEPEHGLAISQQAFVLSLLWFVWCFTGMAGSIANAAHAGGLVAGMILGASPALWRRLRNRSS